MFFSKTHALYTLPARQILLSPVDTFGNPLIVGVQHHLHVGIICVFVLTRAEGAGNRAGGRSLIQARHGIVDKPAGAEQA